MLLVLKYVRAEREADWPLYVAVVKEMLPYFFAAGHQNYARYGLYYARSIETIPSVIEEAFMK
jgi:hypothetical protein